MDLIFVCRSQWLSGLLTALAVHLHEDVAASILCGIVSHAKQDHQVCLIFFCLFIHFFVYSLIEFAAGCFL
jgi:hypothetical protein